MDWLRALIEDALQMLEADGLAAKESAQSLVLDSRPSCYNCLFAQLRLGLHRCCKDQQSHLSRKKDQKLFFNPNGRESQEKKEKTKKLNPALSRTSQLKLFAGKAKRSKEPAGVPKNKLFCFPSSVVAQTRVLGLGTSAPPSVAVSCHISFLWLCATSLTHFLKYLYFLLPLVRFLSILFLQKRFRSFWK
jgi:hypothetical protein